MNVPKLLKEKDKPKKERLLPLGKLQKRADTLMQEVGKIQSPKCILCGKPTDCQHHFFPKSVSSALRYDWRNLVPVCRGCHCRIHQSGDPEYEQRIIQTKGRAWYEELERHKRDSFKINREYYMTVLEKLNNRKARLE